MKIYKIYLNKCNYDSYDGFVIACMNEREVRRIASENSADEGKDAWWLDAKIQYLGKSEPGIKEGVILSSFNAG